MSAAIADLLAALVPSLPQREVLLARPTVRPPAAGAWAPRHLSVQIVISGRIDLAIPDEQGETWTTMTRKHLLIVCPKAWSPRTQRTARRHLAFDFDRHIGVAEYRTPAGGSQSRQPVQRTSIAPDQPALAACLAALLACGRSAARAEVLHGLLLAIMPLLVDALRTRVHADRASDIQHFIRAHCQENLQRSDVARHFSMSADHVTRILRQAGGASFVAVLHRHRLERAADRLRESDDAIATIATTCGFGSPSYLIRLFRRHYGTTPDVWRRAWQGTAGRAG